MLHPFLYVVIAAGLIVPIHVRAVEPSVPSTIVKFVAPKPTKDPLEFSLAHIEVSGEITNDAAARLKAALEVASLKTNARTLGGYPAVYVYLDSPGGNVQAALKMGSLLRASGAQAWVRPNKLCASACILVLAGGVKRFAFDGARLGIHRPFFEQSLFAGMQLSEAQQKYKALSESVRAYLSGMGVSDRLYNQMMNIPSHAVVFLTEHEASEMNLLGEDPAFSEWDRARASEKYRPEFLDWNDCLLSGTSQEKCAAILKAARSKN